MNAIQVCFILLGCYLWSNFEVQSTDLETSAKMQESLVLLQNMVESLVENVTCAKNVLLVTWKELQETKEELRTTQEELQETKEEQRTTQVELQETKEEQRTTQEELQETKEELRTTQEELQETKEELRTTQDELLAVKQQLAVKQPPSSLPTKRNQSQAIVAFTVCPSMIRSYRRGDKVRFDKAVTNYGGHYNTSNSTFKCPWHGIYEFDQHVLTVDGYQIATTVMKNFGPVTSGYTEAYAMPTQGYRQGSNSVLLECQAGDIIWVTSTHGGNNKKLYGEGVDPLWGKYRCDTSFSGKLVYLL